MVASKRGPKSSGVSSGCSGGSVAREEAPRGTPSRRAQSTATGIFAPAGEAAKGVDWDDAARNVGEGLAEA